MSYHRERLSGSKYRKLAHERLEREEKVIASTPKLDHSFVRKANADAEVKTLEEGISSPNINNLELSSRNNTGNNLRISIYRRAVRRKANLEVTGEEKPKTRLRRRKANKRLCREKRPVCALPDEKKPVFAALG